MLVFKVLPPPPPLIPCYNSSARFPQLVRPLSLLLDNFLCCPCDQSMEYFDKQFVSIYNGSDSFPGFLNVFLNVFLSVS